AHRLPRAGDAGEALGARPRAARGAPMTLPETHTLVRAGRVRAAIRRDLVAALSPWLLAPELVAPSDAEPIAGGRGGAFRLALPGGLRVVVRRYRRGGVVARLVHETFLG